MSITVTDLFCGAGGSSSGATAVPGVSVRMAANHWKLAIDTHNTNHPTVDHDCADISQVDPRRYPRTDILWASPECTNHSQAKGKKRITQHADLFDALPDEAAERSRATMWDVVRFAEHHRYRAIVVENVVDAAKWVLWGAWQVSLAALGYCQHTVYLNSMHASRMGDPAPQSRDRLYVVAHRKGDPCPDLNRWVRPRAHCPTHGDVDAVQSWKSDVRWGRYRQQYLYRCPHVSCRNTVVEPYVLPAAAAIDWTTPGERIGDRARPLAPKTVARIEAGLRRYARPIHLEAAGNTFERRPGVRTWPIDHPLTTLHTTASKALAYGPAMLVPVEGRDGKAPLTVDVPMRTQTARNETGLAVPPHGAFVAELRGGGSVARPVTEPLATVTAAGNHHGLVVPYYSTGVARPTSEPLPTVTTVDRHALVMRNNNGGAEMSTPVTEPLRTLTTTGHQSLVEWEDVLPAVEDCLFRMLEPREVQAGMAFARDYIVLGNKREQVRQLGNAVTPPAARDLIAAVVDSLDGVAA